MPQPQQRPSRRADAERNDQALLDAARAVFIADGEHASVAAIAQRAGVGIGSLYRRYRTKTELLQQLCVIALREYCAAADEGLMCDDPWEGLMRYTMASINHGPGSLAPIAGLITVTDEMDTLSRRADEAVGKLVERAHRAGALRADISAADLELLIEQLSRSPLTEQLEKQGRTDLAEEAANAHARVVAIALDGLRTSEPGPLPGNPLGYELFAERWRPTHRPS